MDELIATLRALVISRKDISTLHDILDDYVEFEGKPLEVAKYGFKTLEDLLTASGEFEVTHKKGKTYLIARENECTTHITKMVRKQKTKKIRKVFATGFPAKSKKSQKKQASEVKRRSVPRNSISRSSSDSLQSNWNMFPTESQSGSSYESFRANHISHKKRRRDPEIYWESTPRSPSFDSFQTIRERSRPDSWHSAYAAPPLMNCIPYHQSMPDSTFSSFHRSFPEPIHNYSDLEIAVALEVYAAFRGVAPPSYHVYRISGFRGFFCSVAVDNLHCSTEPSFYESPLQAKIECAYVALKIIHSNCMLRMYPVFEGDSQFLVRKIAEELRLNGGSVACHRIPDLFRSRYGETLPRNWLSVIKHSPQFTLRTFETGDLMVLTNWM